MKILAVNKRATFDYAISDQYEAGLVLSGAEVKSVKQGNASLKEAFVTIHDNELYLTNCHIGPYDKAPDVSYEPTRARKLLLHTREIAHLIGVLQQKGLTLVPLKLYSIKNLVKLSFGVGRGKKKFDKRESIKKRDITRDTARDLS